MATKNDDYWAKLEGALDEQGIRKGDPAEWGREDAQKARTEAHDAEKAKELLGKEGDAAKGSAAPEAARDAEQNPSTPPVDDGFTNNFTGNGKKKGKLLGKKAPLIAIGGGLGLGGVIAIMLVVPLLLFFHLLANLFDTYDTSGVALTQVVKKVIISKLGQTSATSGSCNTVKIWCRFKTPTNELLRELKAQGITALDGSKNPINLDTNKKWPSQRPVHFEVSSFHASNGEKFTFEAKNISTTLVNEAGVRQAFNKTVEKIGSRAFSRWSPAMLGFIDKYKISLRDTLGNRVPDEEGTKKTLRQTISEKVKLKGPAGELIDNASSAAKFITEKISLKIGTALSYIAKASKGSSVVLTMALGCMASGVPSMIKKSLVNLQEAGLISAAAPVMTSMAAVQAGDGDPETADEVATAWTEQDKDGNSALNSIGVRYMLHDDTDISSDPTYNNVTPAAFNDVMAGLDVADFLLNNVVSDGFCPLLMNPVTGAAIAGGVHVVVKTIEGSTGPPGWVAALIDLGIGLTVTGVLNAFGENISDGLAGVVSGPIAELAQEGIEKMDQPYQTFGNMNTSAMGLISEGVGAGTFGTALTTDQLGELAQAKQEQEADEAEIARATLSPFDGTSKYTFLGSMVNQLLPHYSSFSSVSGTLSVIGSLVPTSLGSILKSTTAGAVTDPMDKYSGVCPNEEETAVVNDPNKTLAADIFCHNIYGIFPADNWGPEQSYNAIADQVNEDTGKPIEEDDDFLDTVVDLSGIDDIDEGININKEGQELDMSYGDWLAICSDPENASQCTGNDNSTQIDYGLYTAAYTANSMLDLDGYEEIDDQDAQMEEYAYTAPEDDALVSEGISELMSLFSSMQNLFRAYTASLFTPYSFSPTDALTGFTLWR